MLQTETIDTDQEQHCAVVNQQEQQDNLLEVPVNASPTVTNGV